MCSQRVQSCMYYQNSVVTPVCHSSSVAISCLLGAEGISHAISGNYENLLLLKSSEGEPPLKTCTFAVKLTCYQHKTKWFLKSSLQKI